MSTEYIVRIKGGLGNQLFQYAFGLYLAEILCAKVVYDPQMLEEYDYGTRRIFCLDQLFSYIPVAERCRRMENKFIFKKLISYVPRNFYYKVRDYMDKAVYIEKNPYILSDLNQLKKYSVFDGYWQNIVYAEHLQKLWDLNSLPSNSNLPTSFLNNAVGLHVRLGDYQNSSYHITIAREYYLAAIEHARKLIKNPKFIIFTDGVVEPEWLNLTSSECLYASNLVYGDVNEFKLMCELNGLIIANSTFSWWAAYLTKSQKKLIVAPKNWVRDSRFSLSGLIPNNWHIIDNKDKI